MRNNERNWIRRYIVENFKKWINFLSERNISWVYWSFCNKDEGSSILLPNYPVKKDNTGDENTQNNMVNIDEYLTEAGRTIKQCILNRS